MSRILTWFYCLDLGKAALLVLLAAGIFHWMKCRWGKTRLFSVAVGAGFAAWAAGLLFATVTTRDSGGAYSVNLQLFHSYREVLSGGNKEILRSNFMNGALFFPGGVLLGTLLPKRWNKFGRILAGVLLLGLMSAGVEWIQYTWQLGWVEADDVLHNSLGAFLGLVIGTMQLKWGKFDISSEPVIE
jgi:glycopeptide antibiotics resistance protein